MLILPVSFVTTHYSDYSNIILACWIMHIGSRSQYSGGLLAAKQEQSQKLFCPILQWDTV